MLILSFFLIVNMYATIKHQFRLMVENNGQSALWLSAYCQCPKYRFPAVRVDLNAFWHSSYWPNASSAQTKRLKTYFLRVSVCKIHHYSQKNINRLVEVYRLSCSLRRIRKYVPWKLRFNDLQKVIYDSNDIVVIF